MDFVWMKHAGIEAPAKVPASAVQHWEGVGWTRTEPPTKPPRPTFTAPTPVDAPPLPTDKTTDVADTKTADTAKKPSTRRKED